MRSVGHFSTYVMVYSLTMAGKHPCYRPAVLLLPIEEEMYMLEWMYLEGIVMAVEDITQIRFKPCVHKCRV